MTDWGEGTLERRRRAYTRMMGQDVADAYNAAYRAMIDNMMLSSAPAGVASSGDSPGRNHTDRGVEHDVREI